MEETWSDWHRDRVVPTILAAQTVWCEVQLGKHTDWASYKNDLLALGHILINRFVRDVPILGIRRGLRLFRVPVQGMSPHAGGVTATEATDFGKEFGLECASFEAVLALLLQHRELLQNEAYIGATSALYRTGESYSMLETEYGVPRISGFKRTTLPHYLLSQYTGVAGLLKHGYILFTRETALG